MIKKGFGFAAFILIALAGIVALHHAAAASFNQNLLIDDVVFDNVNSMTASQIDSWLNTNFPNSCLSTNNGFSTPDIIGYAPSTGFVYGGNVSAGTAIYDAAQAYGLNPQVLLATLEKESSVVTGNASYHCQYMNTAMGFDCPDSGSCPVHPDTESGFSKQIIWASWFLRHGEQRSEGNVNWAVMKPGWDNSDESNCYSGPMTQGNFKRCRTDSNPTFYDGWITIDGTAVHVNSGATAALYWYTPHFHGNQNFVSIFQSWFGSTSYPEPIGGVLYYQISTNKVFLVTLSNNTRYYLPGWSTIQNYKLDRYQIIPTDDTTIQQYTDGGVLTSLLWDTNGVYLVNNGIKYHAPSAQVCTDWGLACFDNTITKQLGSTFQNSYLASGTDLASLASYQGIYYKMQAGARLPIADKNTLSALSYSPNQALSFTDVNVTQPLGNLLLSTITPIAFGGTIYYFDGTNYHKVPDYSYIEAWNIKNILVPPVSTYNTSPPASSPDLSKWYQDNSGNKYLIDQGRKLLLNSSQQQVWPGASYQTFTSGLANNLPQASLTNFVWSSPNLYTLSDGQKHYVPTYDDYLSLGINSQNTTSLSPAIMALATQGSDAFGSGKLIGISNGQKIYVVNGHKLLHITSPEIFAAYGFDWGKIATYPSSILSDYPDDGDLPVPTQCADGTYNFIVGNQRLKMSPQTASSYGLQVNQFKLIDQQLCSRFPNSKQVSKFLYNSDTGQIFYASGGALHYVSSYQSYIGYGGQSTPSTIVNNAFINDFLMAQPV